ncbi:MAG: hypothetical protein H6Q89_3023 [Myxococcaceae bacterium]|nr:hypothetical protein [Myxococcaceae bacterium]
MFAPLLAVALLALPPTGEVSTARFRIVHTQNATGAAKMLSEQIEPLRDQLQQVLGRDWDGITEIRLGMGRAEYEALALPGGAPPSWAVALAYPEANVILVDAHSLVKGDGQATLRHELVHVALGRLGHHWPRWFHEGLAQMVTGEQRYSVTQYATLARAVSTDRIFRFEDLSEGFPDLPSDVEIAYAQSAAFVAWLHDRYGPAGFGALVDGVRAGEPFETSFGKAFHTSLSVEAKAFTAELPGRYPLWPVIATGTTMWAALSGLVVFAYFRRRRHVIALRAEQAAQEAAEDAAARILAAEQAAVQAQLDLLADSGQTLTPSPDEPGEKPTIH